MIAAAIGLLVGSAAFAQTTAFTYQGLLEENGTPFVGDTVDLVFRLYTSETGSERVGQSPQTAQTPIQDGVFSVELDFGVEAFVPNEPLWLEVSVGKTDLGRQPLLATPYALNTRGIQVNDSGQPTVLAPIIKEGASDDGWQIYRYGLIGNLVFRDRPAGAPFRDRIVISPEGRVSINGGDAPAPSLPAVVSIVDAEENGPTNGTFLRMRSGATGGGFRFDMNLEGFGGSQNNMSIVSETGIAGPIMTWDDSGFVGVGVDVPTSALDVDGAVTIRGGADIVEGFDSICGTAWEPGTVLSIDPENPGMLTCSEGTYDRKVAGVVSGAGGVQPGLKLGQAGVLDGEILVAMTGRVYVKGSAENGAIEPGDLLTTAGLAGHAMKATNPELSNGSVIGKAMSSLEDGSGLVLVLVNLQ